MPFEFKIPTKPTIKLIDPDGTIERDLKKAGTYPPPLRTHKGEPQENFPENLSTRRRLRDQERPKLSLKPPHTKFAVIPSRAITDPRINTRKPLLLLLGAIGIHASVHGICYPSQRRLAMLCGKSQSWAHKYLHELIRMGYVKRLLPPQQAGNKASIEASGHVVDHATTSGQRDILGKGTMVLALANQGTSRVIKTGYMNALSSAPHSR
jgi:hypothetical protein